MKLELGTGLIGAWGQLDPIAVAEQQLLDAAAAPPEAIGGVEITQQPGIANLLEQGVLQAHARGIKADLR
jgi:hypothetical protein